MESSNGLDIFHHKNKSKILLSFLNGKNEIVSGIGLQRLLQFIKERDFDASLSVALLQNDEECWLCIVKEKLFKDLWKVCDGTAKIVSTEESPTLFESAINNETPSVDRIWKVVRDAGNMDDSDGVITVRHCKLADCMKINGARSLPSTKEVDDKDAVDWKNLCISVAESLLKYSDESLHDDTSLTADEKSQRYTFAVESNLSNEELKSRISAKHICRNNEEEGSLSKVKFETCCNCLGRVSFDVLRPNEEGGIVHSVSQLVNHLIATIYATADEFCKQDLLPEPQGSDPEEKVSSTDPEKPCYPVAVTLICKQDESFYNTAATPVQTSMRSPSKSQFQKPACSIGPPITVSLSSCIFTNTPTTVTKSTSDGNRVVTRDGLRISKLPATFTYKKGHCVTQAKPLVQLYGQKVAKLPMLTIVGKNGVLTKRKPVSVLSTLPGLSATFKRTARTNTVTVKPDQSKLVKNVTLTTIDNKPGTSGPKRKKYLVKMLHPTAGEPFQTVTSNSQMVRVISSSKSPLVKMTQAVSATNATQKVKHEQLLSNASPLKGAPVTRLCCKIIPGKKDKPVQEPSTAKETTSPKKKNNNSSTKASEETDPAVNPDTKSLSQQALGASSKPTRVKTPSKRKSTGQGASMKSIVQDFFATSSSVDKTEQNNAMPYNTKQQRRGRRRRQGSTHKIIPIPYESHYLCIYETLAKKGWKAYWFRKCRCARSGKKKISEKQSEEGSAAQDNAVNDESAKQETSCAKRKRKQPSKDDAKPPKASKVDLGEVSSLAVVIPKCSSMNTSNNSSKLQDLVFDNNLLTSIKVEDKTAKLVVVDPDQKQSDPSEESFANIVDVTSISGMDVVELHQPEADTESKWLSHPAPLAKQLSRTEVLSRRRKVECVYRNVLKNQNTEKKSALDLQVSKTPCSIVMRPYVFSQFFQEVDKQPSCLEVVSVHSSLLRELPDLCKEAAAIERKRNSRCSLLLKPVLGDGVYSGKPAVVSGNDLLPIWSFGKSEQFFLEKKKQISLQRKKIFLKNRQRTILEKQKQNNFENKKALNKKGGNNIKSLGARSILKRSLLTFGKKVYRHHSRRPKAARPVASKTFDQTEENFVPVFDAKRFSPSWIVPHTSVSEVVRKIEELWCEEEEFRGFVGLNPNQTSNGLVTLTADQVACALSALNCGNETFTFSSKKSSGNETFTFSSKKKKGKNTVLLIRRKLISSPGSNSHVLDDEAHDSDCSFASPTLPKQRKMSDDKEMEFDSESVSPKLLLKLRKTGEVSGSAIYSVPERPIRDEEASSQSAHESATTSSQCGDVCTTETCSVASSCDVLPQNNEESNVFFTEASAMPASLANNVEPNADTQLINSNFKATESGDRFPDGQPCAAADVSAALEHFVDDAAPAPQSERVSSFNFKSENDKENQHKADNEFNNSICAESSGILSSSIISSTPLKVPSMSTGLLHQFSCLKEIDINDYETSQSSNIFGAESNEIINLEKKVPGENGLEDLLQFISVDSLDVLESIFVFDEKHDISPSDLLKILKADTKLDKSFSDKTKLGHLKSRSSRPFERRRYPCIANGSFTCSANEYCKFSSPISSIDSPETARGMSQSKNPDDNSDRGTPRPPNSLVLETESERELQPSPLNLPSQDLSLASDISVLNQQMKTCNVILEPLDRMFKDFKTNGNTSFDDVHPSINRGEYNVSNLPEPSARELNRLLKNQALNGAYWKPIESDPRSSATCISASHWRLRERRKRTHSETRSVEIEELIHEEPYKLDAVEETGEVAQKRKRKKVQYVEYLPSSNISLLEVADSLWNNDANQLQSTDSRDGSKRNGNEKPKTLNCDALQSLFDTRVDFDRVRNWIFNGTVSHPRPLRFPFLFARRSATKQNASKTNSRNTSEARALPDEESLKGPKKNTKVSGRDSTSRRSSKSSTQDELFEELRRALFKARHPHYKGDLCNGSSLDNVPDCTVRLRKPLSLLRVNADEARKKDCPSLCREMLVEVDRKRFASGGKVETHRLAASESSSDSEASLTVSVRRKIDEEIKRNAVVVSLDTVGLNPIEVAAPVALSSRGRALKPSMRNRSLRLQHKSNTKPGAASLPPLAKKSPPVSPHQPSQSESPPLRNRERARYVNKHSTCGSYIKKVIDSGMYDF